MRVAQRSFAWIPVLLMAVDAPAVGQPSPVPVPAPAPAATPSPLEGIWHYAGGDAERRAFEASVLRTVQGMGPIIEGIAASRLRERNPVPDTITIRVENGTIDFTGQYGRRYRSPADGAPVQTTNAQGEAITLSTRLRGNTMIRDISREGGGRHETFTVDGDSLVLDGTISSPRLPRPLTYRFTFRR